MEKERENEKVVERKDETSGTSACAMNARYKETYRATRDHRAAVRAYCSGNVWATENAKAVGNW